MIRALFTLAACLLFATGCGRDATSMGMDPEPPAPEPEVGEPEAPGPEAPEPEPGLPALPPVESAAQDGVFRGRGTTLVQMRGRHVFAGTPRVEVEIFDADDASLGTLDAVVAITEFDFPVTPGAGERHAAYTLEDGEWLLQHYWPGTLAGVRAEATLFDGDAAVLTLNEPMFAVPIVDGDFDAACDSAGFANRCPDGSACFVAPRPVQGFCRTATVDAWLLEDGVTLDVMIADSLGFRTVIDVLLDGQVEPVEMESGWTQRFLAPGIVAAADSIDVFFNAHRVRTPVRAPEERWIGDECDSLEIANQCAAGRCGIDAICVDPQAPIIEQATYNIGRVWDGAHVIGQDADGDIAALELTFIDGETRVPQTFNVRGGFSPGQPVPSWRLSLRVEEDGRFELLMDREDWGGIFAERVEVVIIDREGLRSEPVIAGRGRPEGRGDLIGARTLCDRAQSGFWGACEEGTVCARGDGEANYECTRIEACAEPARYVALADAPVSVALRDLDNRTRLPCNAGGSDGGEGRLVFTAPEGALYRFTARGGSVAAIELRAHCDLSGGDGSACVGAEVVQGTDELSVTDWFAAGETVYVLVEAVDYNSMVEVSVDAME